MGQEVKPLDTLRSGDDANGLLEVRNRKLARLAVNVVAKERTAGASGGPCQDNADKLVLQRSANLVGGECRIFEAVVVSVNEDDDFLAFGRCETPANFGLQRRDGLFMRRDRLRSAA
ncbi:hypothetical protein D9M72_427470 [compost metagenome]